MKSNANKLLVISAIALLASGSVFTASTKPASAEAGYFWDETVESVDRSPWIFEGTNVFGELARVPPSDWVRTLEKRHTQLSLRLLFSQLAIMKNRTSTIGCIKRIPIAF